MARTATIERNTKETQSVFSWIWTGRGAGQYRHRLLLTICSPPSGSMLGSA